MATPASSGKAIAGVPVVTAAAVEEAATASSSSQASHEDSPLSTAVVSLLWTGVRVVVRKSESGAGGVPEYGRLSLNEDSLEFTAKSTRTIVTTTRISSIREVVLEQQTAGQGQQITHHVCRVKLKAGEPGSSFSFVCRDDANGLSSSEITKLAALVMQERHGLAPKNTDRLVEDAYQMTSFDELLRPVGLVDKYLEAFQRAGVHFENLGLVTRTDLEKMGVTDRVDQINILGLMNRYFRGAPPRLHPTGLDRSRQEFLGLPIVGAHLAAGLRVVVRSGGKNGHPECGMLSLAEDSVVFSAQNTLETAVTSTTCTKISSIRGVQFVHEEGGGQEGNHVCLVMLKEGAPGSFNFLCRDAANGLSSSEVTKIVGLMLRQRINMGPKGGNLLDHAHLMTPFVNLLEPLGLVDNYCGLFAKSGVHFENLGVVTRDDLAAIGVAAWADQINILGQIERCFQLPPPDLPTCVCNCRREKSSGESSSEFGAKQAVATGQALLSVVEAFAGL